MLADSIVYPVERLDAAIAFFSALPGSRLRMRDGHRYAALDLPLRKGGCIRIGLLAGAERIVAHPALSLRVSHLGDALRACRSSGAEVDAGPQQGPHETRAVVRVGGGPELLLVAVGDTGAGA